MLACLFKNHVPLTRLRIIKKEEACFNERPLPNRVEFHQLDLYLQWYYMLIFLI